MRALCLVLAVSACAAHAPAHPRHDADEEDDEGTSRRGHDHSFRRDRDADADDDDDDKRPTGDVVMIAATADGKSAVAANDTGHVRLWPVIAGAGIALDLPAPRALALTHDTHGFEIFEVDAAGDLLITTVDAKGVQHAHTSLANDPPFVGVVMAAVGAVAWRADHTIVVVKSDGKIASQLAAPAGDRVAMVATAGAHAVVMLDTRETRRLRHLALDKLAWGAWIGDDVLAAVDIALAPNAKRLAIVFQGDGGRRVEVIDTANGKLLAEQQQADDVRTIAFADANHAAIVGALQMSWLDFTGTQPVSDPGGPMTRGTASPAGVGGGHLVLAKHRQLYVVTPP